MNRSLVQDILKRALDIFGAAIGLVLLSVPMLVVAALVRAKMGTPVLFRQTRVGLDERLFTVYKFRTMTDAVDADGKPLPDTARLTPLGTFLRRTELDELPELLNILRGDMSLVGPRPLFPWYVPYYTPRERLRHSVRPGLTGWAQINGLNKLGWDDRLALDVWYVENRSFWLDVKILMRTIPYVLRGHDADADPRTFLADFAQARRAHAASAPAERIA